MNKGFLVGDALARRRGWEGGTHLSARQGKNRRIEEKRNFLQIFPRRENNSIARKKGEVCMSAKENVKVAANERDFGFWP